MLVSRPPPWLCRRVSARARPPHHLNLGWVQNQILVCSWLLVRRLLLCLSRHNHPHLLSSTDLSLSTAFFSTDFSLLVDSSTTDLSLSVVSSSTDLSLSVVSFTTNFSLSIVSFWQICHYWPSFFLANLCVSSLKDFHWPSISHYFNLHLASSERDTSWVFRVHPVYTKMTYILKVCLATCERDTSWGFGVRPVSAKDTYMSLT